jgi:site-specific DNA-adenine methylase
MTTITDIRNDLVNVFNKLRDGTMESKEAAEINNTAGKIIASIKVQLDYATLRGERPDISFLDGATTIENSKPAALTSNSEQK